MVRLDTATVGGGFVLAGLTHLLAPRPLLAVARRAYRQVLAAEFDGDERTERRVRAVGLVLLAIGTVVAPARRSISIVLEKSR
ncbi:hypothetical protein [Halalkalicoccus jeotgali]|uniref:Uncharacterized protein n=1 Tax=Halalkalicoccus jeotgali (strain DSM 18796 / CECT 7217 / JCM 14584 / KCTC 4019 / B3) TaxID=795797 RepID=D8JAJ8_HALJB|nr:hypothetical protein [Halalkalicoccus jeotgali]ADJ14720.1 hypothetical protein HacjB3_06655 [Halalkalicoccus jeotgali B3]ELY39516.1 hypothetical protein C497_05057 [Halalkalicoccus jeotgali B3]